MSPDRPLRGALIGAGNVMQQGHLPAWLARTDVQIVAAADPLGASATAIQSAVPRIGWFPTAAELISEGGIDFVDVATPPATHAEICHGALDAGLHVLCEKPLALSSADARDLAAFARAKGRVLACVDNWNFAPQIRSVTEIARSGSIGEIRKIVWCVRRDRPAATAGGAPNWRIDAAMSGGGISVDHGWHAIYIVLSWVGRPPNEVAARFERRLDAESPVEDTAEIHLDFGSASADISLTWAAPDRSNLARLEGDSGTVDLADDRLDRRSRSGESIESRHFPARLSAGSHHADWFGGVAETFLAEVRDPSARGANLAAAVACAEVLDACAASARDAGRPRKPELS